MMKKISLLLGLLALTLTAAAWAGDMPAKARSTARPRSKG